MEIGFATHDTDKEAVYRLRYDIYIRERREKHATAIDGQMKEAVDAVSYLFYAKDQDRMVGTLRLTWGAETAFSPLWEAMYDLPRFSALLEPTQMAVFSRFVVRPEYRGSVAPFQLVGAALSFCWDHGIAVGFADCQPYLLDVYLRLGFRTYKQTLSDPAVGLSIPIILLTEDTRHFRKVRSPLLFLLKGRTFASPIPQRIAPLIPSENLAEHDNVRDWLQTFSLLSEHEPAGLSIFQDMTDAEIEYLITRSHVIVCDAHAPIIREGVRENTVFVVLEGNVEIWLGDTLVQVIPAGGVVGELAYLLHLPRTATVKAASEAVRIMSLSDTMLNNLAKSNAVISAKFFRNLARIIGARLVATNQKALQNSIG